MFLRVLLLLGCLGISIGTGYYSQRYLLTSTENVPLVKPSEAQKTALQLARSHDEQFLEVAVLLIAGLWGVAIVNENSRLRRGDWPEILMFFCSVALCAVYFFLENHSTDVTLRLLRDVQTLDPTQVPDVLSSSLISAHRRATDASFYGALISSALTATSLCLLRGKRS